MGNDLLVAIDPGPEQSAFVLYNKATRTPLTWGKLDNATLMSGILDATNAEELAVEMIASYGMAVGATVFETCVWIGRFIERWSGNPIALRYSEVRRVTRMEVKMYLCNSARAGDPNVRQALLDRYGGSDKVAKGTKAAPGPLYGVAKDVWAALGVAVTASET